MWPPPERSRAFACQRSMVLFSTCPQRYLWGLCRSRSDGGTGSRFDKLTASTTTWTPNWKAPCVSEVKQNYGNCTLLIGQRFGMCVSVLRTRICLLSSSSCTVSHPIGAVTWHLAHCLWQNLPSVWAPGFTQRSSPLSLLQHIPQRTALSGCSGDAPGGQAGGGGGHVVVELRRCQEMMRRHRTDFHIWNFFEIDWMFFLINTSLQKSLQGTHQTRKCQWTSKEKKKQMFSCWNEGLLWL